jgi:hypothetical protein
MKSNARKTFAGIVPQAHPDADRVTFTAECAAAPDAREDATAGELAAIIEQSEILFGKSDGEWKYLDENKRDCYIESIWRPQAVSLSSLFANMFRNDATYGVMTPSYADVNQAVVKNQILLDLDSCHEFTRLSEIGQLLFEQAWGNQFCLLLACKVLSPDSPRHYYFAEKLAALVAGTTKQRIVGVRRAGKTPSA